LLAIAAAIAVIPSLLKSSKRLANSIMKTSTQSCEVQIKRLIKGPAEV